MELIDGKRMASEIRAEIAREVAACIDQQGTTPHLAAVLVGDDPASQTYVRNKEKDCLEVGIISSIYKYPSTISEKELLQAVDFINKDDDVNGMIVQLPLPAHISWNRIIEHIKPSKDVDGFHPVNIGRLALDMPAYLPATPFGILQLMERYQIETEGKECVILGRSHIVGSPLSILLSKKRYPGNCTVTLCHSKSKNIEEICKRADILIAAIGRPEFVREYMVKKNAVVIDVGTNRVRDDSKSSGFALVGDVKFDEVSEKCSFISPVPGGVGPMTRAALLVNTLKAFKNEVYKSED
ncbi:MAG: bifunctional 5,10-methylene-tetrahydrofolate dehydrogenase/5,10-methylene-tetrahydrofolate cyclohydrolase [Bacteroidetes bacterium]|nr:bifunctional 5,10-methylene-tetrahydrofolate dehydrogenase/5,10-methylene-tetrahydrofolate cyclohydrolase [Bacteroidota bacterium]